MPKLALFLKLQGRFQCCSVVSQTLLPILSPMSMRGAECRAHGRQRPNLGTLARRRGQISTPGMTENNSISEQAIQGNDWSHATEQNSPMHLRQEKQETYHTQTRGKAQHNSCIKHIPTQHSHLIVLSTWGAGCNARARGRPHARTFINQRTNHCWRRQFSQQSGPTLLGNTLLCALGKGARDASYPTSGAQPSTTHTPTFQRST